MITAEHLMQEFDRMIRATEVLFGLVPDDKTEWAPHEGMLTAGQQMLHMAASLKAYTDACTTGEWSFRSMDEILTKNHETPSGTPALALRLLSRMAKDFRTMVGSMDESTMNAEIYSPQFERNEPRRTLILFCLEHHLSHKAELFMYLRLMGVQVGSKELYFGRER